jgi:hypothetical protein
MVADEPYPNLLGQKGGGGFPYLVFMDETGKVLARAASWSVDGFNETFGVLDDWRTMKAKFEAGDEKVATDLLLAELQLGQITFPEARTRREALQKVSRKQARTLDEALANAECQYILKTSNGDPLAAAPKLLEMKEAGRIPTGGAGVSFFDALLTHASSQKDAKLFQKTLVDMKRRYLRDRSLKDFFEAKDMELARLRRGK